MEARWSAGLRLRLRVGLRSPFKAEGRERLQFFIALVDGEAKKLISVSDQDNDGFISKEEFVYGDDTFSAADDGDGKLSPEEVRGFLERRVQYLSREGRRNSVGMIAPKYLAYAERILKRNDENGDGVLTEDAWKKMLIDLTPADLNGDGTLTVEEYALYLKRKARN